MDFTEVINEKTLPVIVADNNGIIQRVNEAFTKSYGWTEQDLKASPLTAIIPEELRDAHHMGISRAMDTGETSLLNQYLDLEIVYKDGSRAVAPHFITMGEIDGGVMFAAIIQPPK